MFPVPCLSTSPGHLAVASDESREARMVALAVDSSAIAEEDAGLSIVGSWKLPEPAHVDHHPYSDEIRKTVM